jgi:hypothetical protein
MIIWDTGEYEVLPYPMEAPAGPETDDSRSEISDEGSVPASVPLEEQMSDSAKLQEAFQNVGSQFCKQRGYYSNTFIPGQNPTPITWNPSTKRLHDLPSHGQNNQYPETDPPRLKTAPTPPFHTYSTASALNLRLGTGFAATP